MIKQDSVYLSVVIKSEVMMLLKRSSDVKKPNIWQYDPTIFACPYRLASEGAITNTEAKTPLRDRFTIAKWSTPLRCLCVRRVTMSRRQLPRNVDNVRRVNRRSTTGCSTEVST